MVRDEQRRHQASEEHRLQRIQGERYRQELHWHQKAEDQISKRLAGLNVSFEQLRQQEFEEERSLSF